jgi:hypothetical protein
VNAYKLTPADVELLKHVFSYYISRNETFSDDCAVEKVLIERISQGPTATIDDRDAEGVEWHCPTCGTEVLR